MTVGVNESCWLDRRVSCADDDKDGVCDRDEVCPGGNDRLDADGDGIPDDCDPCPDLPAGDANDDGSCNEFDVCTARGAEDIDGDLVCDDQDTCISITRDIDPLTDWAMSTDQLSWAPVTLPNTGWGCEWCTRFYRVRITGRIAGVHFRFASDNYARMLVNGQVVFDEFFSSGYCTDQPCCARCCDRYHLCLAHLSDWRALDDAALLAFGPGENEIVWEAVEETTGDGFHSEMQIDVCRE